MEIKQEKIADHGIKFFVEKDGEEVGRAYLFMMPNSLHQRPFGLLEDIFVKEEFRKQGIGTELVKTVIEFAKLNCYKLIGTSRHSREKVHQWYEKLGFKNHGLEFRMNF